MEITNNSSLLSKHASLQDFFSKISGERDPKNVILMVGNEERIKKYVLSRYLLTLSSDKFAGLLKTPEGEESEEVRIPDVAPKDFDGIVQHITLQNQWKFGNIQDALSLLEAADKFGLQDLQRMISEEMLSLLSQENVSLSEDTACYAYSLFQRSEDETRQGLVVIASNYISKNASLIFKQNRLLSLSQHDFGGILAQDDLEVESELDVFKALLRWGMNTLKVEEKKVTSENMQKVIGNLIWFIRFPNMKKSEFEDYVLPLDILTSAQIKWMDKSLRISPDKNSGVMMFSSEGRKYLSLLAGHGLETPNQNTFIRAVELARAEAFLTQYHAESDRLNSELVLAELQERQCSLEEQNKELTVELEATKKELEMELKAMKKQLKVLDSKVMNDVPETTQIEALIDFRMFMNASAKKILELTKFAGTDATACAVLMKNATATVMTDPKMDPMWMVTIPYISMPSTVSVGATASFGFTSTEYSTGGLFSYRLGKLHIVGQYYVSTSDGRNCNNCTIAVSSRKLVLDMNLFDEMIFGEWDVLADRKKICCDSTVLQGTVEFANIRVSVKMTSGPKSLMSILVSEV